MNLSGSKKRLPWPSCMMLLLASGTAFAASALDLQTFKTHSRLTIRVDDTVDASIQNSKQGFELSLKGVNLSDLGAPLGEEEEWKGRYEKLSDSRLGSLKLTEDLGVLKISGRWKFPAGPEAPAHPEMEFFEYRDKTPAQYVLDFWPKRGPTWSEIKATESKARARVAQKKKEEIVKERVARNLASAKHEAEVDELKKFCESPISETNDIFLKFAPVHEKVKFSTWLSGTTPDQGYAYIEPEGSDRESQYVRVIIKLYREGKPGLAIKTLDFFRTEFPESGHALQLKLLRASSLIKLSLNQEGEELLVQMMHEQQESGEALHSAIYMANQYASRGSHAAALETFLWLINRHSDHRLGWVFHLGAAESFFALKQPDRALKEYQWVIENSPDSNTRSVAALRMGDLFSDRFQYEQALAAYFQGTHYFPAEAKAFAPIHINRAEALYGIGDLAQAEKTYLDFLEKFPTHPAGWRAAFRLGEIYARKEPKESAISARKWYYETINRYPASPGALLSRVRLAPCGDHAGLNASSQDRFFTNEAAKFDGGGEVSMGNYHDFVGLAHVRTMVFLADENKTVAAAIQELKTSKTDSVKHSLHVIVSSYFRKSILSLLSQGKKFEALAFFRDKFELLPKGDSGVNPDYLVKLSLAASDLGLGRLAQEISENYRAILASRADADKKRNIAAATPPDMSTDPEAQLKLAEQSFSEAKALWIGTGPGASDKIRELLQKVNTESRYAYDKELILGLLDEKAAKFSSALSHAAKAQLLTPTLGETAPDYRLQAWLASLQARAGDSSTALEIYRNVEKHLLLKSPSQEPSEAVGVPAIPPLSIVLLAEAEILEKQSKWGEASATYARAMDQGVGGNQVVYGYARALMRTGSKPDRAKAFKTLEQLVSSKDDDFWKRLAKETLADEKSKQTILDNAKEGN